MSGFSQGLAAIDSLLGTKYVWGGNDANGIDCSGFTRAVYSAMGIDLPRVSYQQANGGQKIGRQQAQPGDLVSWDLNGRNPGADHVGIYMGDGKVAEASSSSGKVVIRNLWGNAEFTRYGGIDGRDATSTGGAPMHQNAGRAELRTPEPQGTNPLGTLNTQSSFGGTGFALDDTDRRQLAELYKYVDVNDQGETADTVGPANVARLSWDREGPASQAGIGIEQTQLAAPSTPERFNQAQHDTTYNHGKSN